MAEELVTRENKLRARELAFERQPRFEEKARVQVDSKTWVLLSPTIAQNQKKLKAYLKRRAKRLQKRKERFEAEKRSRMERGKISAQKTKQQKQTA
ncbi:hypothetical protein [Microscilla marina]|uniref:Uncharacterized protein n=1 Tax=Microscilla marina ATCC 23134 TaxID=313606 RepID=A1ZU80_MICM2|nr:hypothetical protein [Microscilla marina]EAY26051.1 hypothetical protein M23134_06400 [Microscilla marina ATCC 23134]